MTVTACVATGCVAPALSLSAYEGKAGQAASGSRSAVQTAILTSTLAVEHDAFLKVAFHDGKDIHKIKHFGRHINAELRTALELGSPPEFMATLPAMVQASWLDGSGA